jgi:hypothetical protein
VDVRFAGRIGELVAPVATGKNEEHRCGRC